MSSTIVVTGASSGIGREVARLLAPRASHLVLVARRLSELEALATQLSRRGLTIEPRPCDLTDRTARADLASSLSDLERVDLLVSAAGAGSDGLVDDEDIDVVHRLMELNLLAAMDLTYAVLPGMLRRDRGQILVIGSGAGTWAMPRQVPYVTSKFGLHGFCEALRLDLRGTGVTVTESMPGPVDTGFDEAAGIEGGMDSPVARTRISAQQCALDTVKALDAGKAVCYPGRSYNALMRFSDLVPRPIQRRMAAGQPNHRPPRP